MSIHYDLADGDMIDYVAFPTSNKYVATIRKYSDSYDAIDYWCFGNGGVTNNDKLDHEFNDDDDDDDDDVPLIVIDGMFVDFYDRELYTLFKLTWG